MVNPAKAVTACIERKTKPGKSHPMPEPVQYLRNALNVHCKDT
jgi:hypothetical protein